jgi:hypothetical protein
MPILVPFGNEHGLQFNVFMNLGFIPTLELPERKRGQLVVVAFCPVCDRAEEALDEGQGPDTPAN